MLAEGGSEPEEQAGSGCEEVGRSTLMPVATVLVQEVSLLVAERVRMDDRYIWYHLAVPVGARY